MDEILDIVNEHDQIIGQMYRSEIYKQKLKSFRVINAFLVNNRNELWIPRRTHHKKLFPLCLDASVGGHVMSGEHYHQAFERELQEELNLNAADCNYEIVARLTPHTHNASAFMHLFIIHTSITPHYNTNDFESAQWISIQDLQSLIKNGEPTKGDFPLLITAIELFLQEHV